MGANLTLIGDKKLQIAMDVIEPKLGKKVVKKAVRGGAKIIQRQAKANAPRLNLSKTRVGPGTQMPNPGTLRKGIKVRTGRKKKFHYRINVVMDSRARMGIPADSKFYAPQIIENQTRFMRRAFEQKGAEAEAFIVKEIRSGLLNLWRAI